MGSMINLSDCRDENILKNFEMLKSNIPMYLKDEAKYNPFIQYIESVGRISEDLLDFLYHSDFLSLISENTISAVKTFYDNNAEIEWFYLIQKIFEEYADEADEYVALIMECFEYQEDIVIVEALLEESEFSTVEEFRKKVEEYRKKINEGKEGSYQLNEAYVGDDDKRNESDFNSDSSKLSNEIEIKKNCTGENVPEEFEKKYFLLKEKVDQLSMQYDEVFNKLQDTYMVNKEQERKFKLEIESLKKDHELKDKFIALEKGRNAELIMKIHELEDNNDVLLDENADLKKRLEAANEEIENSRQELLNLQANVTEDADDDLEKRDESQEEEKELNDLLAEAEQEEDYRDVSFVYDETERDVREDQEVAAEVDQQEEEPYEYKDVMNVVSDKGVIIKKCIWFFDNLFDRSRKIFLKKSRMEQEQLIFIKMMELHLPMDNQKSVREALTNLGDKIPCFDLYKLICTNPTNDELMSFLSGFKVNVVEE